MRIQILKDFLSDVLIVGLSLHLSLDLIRLVIYMQMKL